MRILGIETSCDETSASIVTDRREILAHYVHSQVKDHAAYAGVVPEIASRNHLHYLPYAIEATLKEAGCGLKELDAIAVTSGPGLIGGVIVGVMMAKGMAAATGLPLVGVNHLEGHALTVRLVEEVAFPYLLLLVSGGHCQILVVEAVGRYRLLGQTRDDAVGEAFDKVAKMLGLGYPGGPVVEKMAQQGDPTKIPLPRPLLQEAGCDFSFSGLKTAVLRQVEAFAATEHRAEEKQAWIADLCASFQQAASDILCDRIRHAMEVCRVTYRDHAPLPLVVAGGVAANQFLRGDLQKVAAAKGARFIAPPLKLCTDNGAMIAWAGLERARLGLYDDLALTPRARWPLTELQAVG